LRLEDSQVETAERLLKLVAIAAHAAVLTLELLQARDGRSGEPASLAFTAANSAPSMRCTRNTPAGHRGSTTLIRGAAWLGQLG
jgi:hypothetical protein